MACIQLKATSSVAGVRASRKSLVCRAAAAPQPTSRRELLGFGALFALVAAAPAKADVTADLLAKSGTNKALNDKKRLATSYANVARSRTVADGTCSFPNNFFGCDETSSRLTGGVKYIADDFALECEGKDEGKCGSQVNMKGRLIN